MTNQRIFIYCFVYQLSCIYAMISIINKKQASAIKVGRNLISSQIDCTCNLSYRAIYKWFCQIAMSNELFVKICNLIPFYKVTDKIARKISEFLIRRNLLRIKNVSFRCKITRAKNVSHRIINISIHTYTTSRLYIIWWHNR